METAVRYPVNKLRGRYVVAHWDKYGPMIEACRLHDRYGWDNDKLQRQLASGAYEVVEVPGKDAPQAVAMVRAAICFSQPALEVAALAGAGFDRWGESLMDGIEIMARQIGAKHILVEGRRGWEKKLAALGFKTSQVVMTCAVTP